MTQLRCDDTTRCDDTFGDDRGADDTTRCDDTSVMTATRMTLREGMIKELLLWFEE
jgi:hypothetical protein